MKRDTSLPPAFPGVLAAAKPRRAHGLSRVTENAASSRNSMRAAHAASDEVLISRIVNCDRRAMQMLYARHHVRVYRFVLRVLRDRALSEDVVSDVFLDVWRSADQFEGRSAVSTWLLGIARLKAFSALKRCPEEQLDERTATTIEDPADDPASSFERKETGAILRECLSRLPPEHREILDLVYFHDKSIAEVAEIVGIPSNTVKTRMFGARKRLARMLQSAGMKQVSS
jgi:RNA polymerase sigma-70 factor (ECF subfamily)